MDRRDFPRRVQEWIESLHRGGEPLEWLHRRGLTDESIDKYHFGYVEAGYFAHSIAIPILDGMADYKTTRFRRLDPIPEGRPKYDHPKGERVHLFNISSVRHHTVHLAEGEFDATILEQIGRAAVGVPGINNFREEWKWLFVGNDVRIVFDSEVPGSVAYQQVRTAVGQLHRVLEPVVERIEIVELPIGQDVTSLYCQDPDALGEVLSQYDE